MIEAAPWPAPTPDESAPLLHDTPAGVMIGKRGLELNLPHGCRILWIRQFDEVGIPRGDTVIQPGDLLTVIGEPEEPKAFLALCEGQGT